MVTFYDLEWDTEFFGVTCAKTVLHKPLIQPEWDELITKFQDYQFISIENRNSEPINSQMIGKDTKAFLADINIQFTKKLEGPYRKTDNITIYQAFEENEQVIELTEYKFSKFIEDPELLKRGGNQVYRQWVINSFGKQDKYFAIYKDTDSNEIIGYLLHSYIDNLCIIELIAVSKNYSNIGIGTNLFKAVEYAAYEHGCDEIRVGTQVRNIGAINFYHRLGCRQVECNQVYHLWNI